MVCIWYCNADAKPDFDTEAATAPRACWCADFCTHAFNHIKSVVWKVSYLLIAIVH
jgi:hypothetical protein